ncbi:RNA polymerase sigma factor [Catenulispora pinisilvae]|uniref:RNA polymerase sigma factor n=1 Tax=Catenulispora pinisilvae TaxID=2705253 RepID=UPI002B2651E0|nr:sigma-70 family RNA polymerase sigma factor [Catenulispora pinisilvae]
MSTTAGKPQDAPAATASAAGGAAGAAGASLGSLAGRGGDPGATATTSAILPADSPRGDAAMTEPGAVAQAAATAPGAVAKADTADPRAVAQAVAEAHRREWALVLAATARVAGDLDLAEECVQDAYAKALTAWAECGIPRRPAAWLTTAARNRALDVLRRDVALRKRLPLLLDEPPDPVAEIPDERLRLIFTCCHPALALEAQVALTLRLLCGLTTGEVARAFLVSEATMAARITRAKKKIAAARIPYRVPDTEELPERIEAVLAVVDLVFTTGHTAPAGPELVRTDLVDRARDLARMLRVLLPGDAGVAGLLAFILLTDARRAARVDARGRLVLLEDQDRALWDRDAIAEGRRLVREALRRRPPTRYALMAAIAAVHADAASWETTDWPEIVGLYDLLLRYRPSPVAALNRAVAIGFAEGDGYGPERGLEALDGLALEPRLAGYAYLAVARADMLRRLGRRAAARAAYEEALLFTDNDVEGEFLRSRLQKLDGNS